MTAMLAIEYRRGIEDAWSDVASFVPKLTLERTLARVRAPNQG